MPSTLPEGQAVPADGALPAASLDALGRAPFGVYVHVPFCATRCGYCDFNTYTSSELGPGASHDWYADTVLTVRGDQVTDPEQHAAQERLECYRRHGAELPANGGEPALPPVREVARRSPKAAKSTRPARASKDAAVAKVTPHRTSKPSATVSRSRQPEPPRTATCPRCFMQLPATGLCDTCD